MCSRYFIEREDLDELLAGPAGMQAAQGTAPFHAGDIRPAEPAPVIRRAPAGLQLTALRWGWPGVQGGLLINARAETAAQKTLFSRGFRHGRIVLPASGFYEWTAAREKHRFRLPARGLLQMAGLYDRFDGEDRFVILTTQANASVRPVHTRMPLLLDAAQAADWLAGDRAETLLQLTPPPLEDCSGFMQLSLF